MVKPGEFTWCVARNETVPDYQYDHAKAEKLTTCTCTNELVRSV